MSALVNPSVFGSAPPPTGAVYVNSAASVSFGSSTLTASIPSGASTGDTMGLVVMEEGFVSATLTATMSGSGTVLSATMSGVAYSGGFIAFYSRVLSASDISNGNIAITSNRPSGDLYAGAFVYSGISAITPKALDTPAPTNSSFVSSGFAPSGGTLGTATIIFDRSNSASPSAPTSWTLRSITRLSTAAFDVGDRLSGYTNATTTWNGYTLATTSRAGFITELS